MATKERIQNAIESKWRLEQSLAMLIVYAAVSLITFLRMLLEGQRYSDWFEVPGLVLGIFAVIMLPFILYPLWKYYWMLRDWEDYRAYDVKLDRPNTSWLYKGAIYYTVHFCDEHGNQVTMDTKPIFSGGLFSRYHLGDYNNKTVTVYYDAKRERMLVGQLKG